MHVRLPRVLTISAAIFALAAVTSFGQLLNEEGAQQQIDDVEYAGLLNKLQTNLASWEATLLKIDPGTGGASYAKGKDIETYRNVATAQISGLREMIRRERQQRTTYDELAMGMFLTELSADFYLLAEQGALNEMSVDAVSGYGREIGTMQKRLMEDALQRVRSMEAKDCGGVR